MLSLTLKIPPKGCDGSPDLNDPKTGKTQRDRVEREVGGRIGMGNTCISMADSCQCMAKTTTIL